MLLRIEHRVSNGSTTHAAESVCGGILSGERASIQRAIATFQVATKRDNGIYAMHPRVHPSARVDSRARGTSRYEIQLFGPRP